jgi:hypothetical protein
MNLPRFLWLLTVLPVLILFPPQAGSTPQKVIVKLKLRWLDPDREKLPSNTVTLSSTNPTLLCDDYFDQDDGIATCSTTCDPGSGKNRYFSISTKNVRPYEIKMKAGDKWFNKISFRLKKNCVVKPDSQPWEVIYTHYLVKYHEKMHAMRQLIDQDQLLSKVVDVDGKTSSFTVAQTLRKVAKTPGGIARLGKFQSLAADLTFIGERLKRDDIRNPFGTYSIAAGTAMAQIIMINKYPEFENQIATIKHPGSLKSYYLTLEKANSLPVTKNGSGRFPASLSSPLQKKIKGLINQPLQRTQVQQLKQLLNK